jgi:hypothetical protein
MTAALDQARKLVIGAKFLHPVALSSQEQVRCCVSVTVVQEDITCWSE